METGSEGPYAPHCTCCISLCLQMPPPSPLPFFPSFLPSFQVQVERTNPSSKNAIYSRVIVPSPKLKGRFHVGVSEFVARHTWYTYADVDDLVNALHGSFHIPLYCRKVTALHGSWLCDGMYFLGALMTWKMHSRVTTASPHHLFLGAYTFTHDDLPSSGATTVAIGVFGPETGAPAEKKCRRHDAFHSKVHFDPFSFFFVS